MILLEGGNVFPDVVDIKKEYCRDTSDCAFFSVQNSSINNVSVGKMTLYPNPATTYTTVGFNLIPEGRVYIEIIDLLGRKMYQTTEVLNSNILEINTSNLPMGMYILTVTINNKTLSNFKLKIGNQ